jgi:hypothetical protein
MVMKIVALAVVSLAAFVNMAVAQQATKPWTDTKNRFTIQVPASWPVDVQSKPDEDFLYLIAGPADAECSIFVLPNENTATASADRVARAYAKPMSVEDWSKSLTDFNQFSGATVMTVELGASGPWALHSAEMSLTDGTQAYGATQGRPGFEMWQYCRSYDGKDRTAVFVAIARSMQSPQDADWAAQIEAAAAKAAAAPAAAPAQAADAAKNDKKDKKARD